MIRVRLYRTTVTYEGFPVEVTLLDTPLDPKQWTKRDDAALAKLEGLVRFTGVRDPLTEPK